MRILATLVAASHVFLASCEKGPERSGWVLSEVLLGDTGPERTSRPASQTQVRGVHNANYVRPVAEARERDPGLSRQREPGLICHAKRRVVGEERPSIGDAQTAAENAWMGSIRYDHGERYQDLNHAKDVRLNCDPSSVSAVLKTPHFRCAMEATPCRATGSTPVERIERRYEENLKDDQPAQVSQRSEQGHR